jgi:hypothetical protein
MAAANHNGENGENNENSWRKKAYINVMWRHQSINGQPAVENERNESNGVK